MRGEMRWEESTKGETVSAGKHSLLFMAGKKKLPGTPSSVVLPFSTSEKSYGLKSDFFHFSHRFYHCNLPALNSDRHVSSLMNQQSSIRGSAQNTCGKYTTNVIPYDDRMRDGDLDRRARFNTR